MVNNVIGVVNYVIAARPSLLNFVIADTAFTSFRVPHEVQVPGHLRDQPAALLDQPDRALLKF